MLGGKAWRVAMLGLFLPAGVTAQPTSCGSYRVAFYEYGSLAYSVEGQGMAGIDVDILREVSRRTGCKFESIVDSRVRTWTDLAQGKLDMTVSAIEADERAQYARFVIYMKGRNRLLVRTDLAHPIHSLREFVEQGQLRLAVVKGFKHGRFWDEWISTLRQQSRVDDYADANMAARLVALGRDAAFISEPVVWGRILAASKLEGKVSVIDAFPTDNYSAGFAMSRSRVRDEDASKIQAAIADMRADGSLYRIFRDHLPQAEALGSVP